MEKFRIRDKHPGSEHWIPYVFLKYLILILASSEHVFGIYHLNHILLFMFTGYFLGVGTMLSVETSCFKINVSILGL
jgi:hypothetical protein